MDWTCLCQNVNNAFIRKSTTNYTLDSVKGSPYTLSSDGRKHIIPATTILVYPNVSIVYHFIRYQLPYYYCYIHFRSYFLLPSANFGEHSHERFRHA
jgi:hypothetical protein